MGRWKSLFRLINSVGIVGFGNSETYSMPQKAPIALNDGTADHTFNPQGPTPSGAQVFTESTGVPLADKRLVVTHSSTAGGKRKVALKLTFPVVQNATVDGITQPRLIRSAYCDVLFTFDASSLTTERNDMRLMLVDLLGDGQTFAGKIIDDLEAIF